MNKLRNPIIGVTVLAGLALVGSLFNARPSRLQAASGPTVTIDSTQLPLHVTGAVTIDPSQLPLHVTGPVTIDPSQLPLRVTGSTTIGGTVNIVDQRDKNPYQQSIAFNETGGLVNAVSFNRVPNGFRLVITHVSVSFSLASGGTFPLVILGPAGDPTGSGTMPRIHIPPVNEGPNFYVAAGPVTGYAEAGVTPTILLEGQFLSSSNTAQATIVGYLVAVP